MRCVKILSYTIPMYGNKHAIPYGKMLVEHEGKEKTVPFGGFDMGAGLQFITFERKIFFFRNVGGLYSPRFVFDGEETAQ